MLVKRIPPAIWNAGSVMPKAEKIAPPVSAKTARISAAAALARSAIRRRCCGAPAVSETKRGAASIGLMTEKSEENASTTNFASAEESMAGSLSETPAREEPDRRPGPERRPGRPCV